MSLLPTAFRIILNIFFYVVYLVIVLLLTGLILGEFFDMHMQASDPRAHKITYVIALVTGVITLLYRKFFYISLREKRV